MKSTSALRRRSGGGPEHRTLTIGVQGAGAMVGASHLTLLSATYLSSVCGLRVAVAGLSGNDHLRQADRIRDSLCPEKDTQKRFTLYGQSEENLVMDLLGLQGDEQYDVILADCGNANATGQDAPGQRMFRYCQRRIIVANLSWWRLAECADFLERSRDSTAGAGQWEMVGTGVVAQAAAYVRREYGVEIREVPYEPDPFCLHEESLNFCESIYHSL